MNRFVHSFGDKFLDDVLAIFRPDVFNMVAERAGNFALRRGPDHFVIAVAEMQRMPAVQLAFRLSPVFEYRNGFPYSLLDATQNYAAMPNVNRYPNFLSLDSRLSKDIQVSPKYTVRLSLVSYNLTNHFNPDTFHGNTADRGPGTQDERLRGTFRPHGTG